MENPQPLLIRYATSAAHLGARRMGTARQMSKDSEGRGRRDTGALSTSLSQGELSSAWKQEVNRRVAAHRSRKTTGAAEAPAMQEGQRSAGSRAAAAAARVAARYANAPSYNDMLTSEARTAVRAAEIATRVALEAQAAAQYALAGLEAARAAEPARAQEPAPASVVAWELERAPVAMEAAAPAVVEQTVTPEVDRRPYGIKWDADLPVREAAPAVRASHGLGVYEIEVEDWWRGDGRGQPGAAAEGMEVVEPDLPIHGNLIEFPRELVATRKVRPRMAEGQGSAETTGQLSIFEVDPSAISTEPAMEVAGEAAAPSWTAPEWSGIKLDEQPAEEIVPRAVAAVVAEPATAPLTPAPISHRMMAAMVDGSLMVGALLVAAVVAANNAQVLPGLRQIEIGGGVALLVVAVLYEMLFFTLAAATPGMRYAKLALSTFDNKRPTRGQRWSRLGALAVALLPIGLGVALAIFDEDRLSWHDRLSKTYLRKG